MFGSSGNSAAVRYKYYRDNVIREFIQTSCSICDDIDVNEIVPDSDFPANFPAMDPQESFCV